MNNFLQTCIPSIGHSVDWPQVERELEFHKKMLACPQEPAYHGEGDVWTHTKMVVDSLVSSAQWQALDERNRFICFWAALLHDMGKPLVTKMENGLLTSRGHSKVGAIDARIWMWKTAVEFDIREEICQIIEYHQLPFFLLKKENASFTAQKLSWKLKWDNLILVATHDMIGRIYADKSKVLKDIEELDLWLECNEYKKAAYANDYTRFMFLRGNSSIDPKYPLFEPASACQVIMLCGLPGSGKDSIIREQYKGWLSVSFDEERKTLGIKPGQDSGPAVHAAFDKMRKYLRENKNFIFNATNLSIAQRKKALDVFHNYSARVKILYLEKPYLQLLQDDKKRVNSVGQKVIEQMLFKWEVPGIEEAREVEYNLILPKNQSKHEIRKI